MGEMLVREDDAAVKKKKKKRIVQIWLVQARKVWSVALNAALWAKSCIIEQSASSTARGRQLQNLTDVFYFFFIQVDYCLEIMQVICLKFDI